MITTAAQIDAAAERAARLAALQAEPAEASAEEAEVEASVDWFNAEAADPFWARAERCNDGTFEVALWHGERHLHTYSLGEYRAAEILEVLEALAGGDPEDIEATLGRAA